jgi:hypothetical protein
MNASRQLDPTHTAVIAIDFQHDIVGPDGAFASMFSAEVERTKVIPACRATTRRCPGRRHQDRPLQGNLPPRIHRPGREHTAIRQLQSVGKARRRITANKVATSWPTRRSTGSRRSGTCARTIVGCTFAESSTTRDSCRQVSSAR